LGTIITVCPDTGREIATGIETDAATFSRIASIVGSVWCPHCQADHEWSVATARLREISRGE